MFDPSVLSAAIPGMSLTTEPGNRPWENPPAIATVEDAIEYYSERLLDPENAEAVLDPIVQGVSIESIVDTITTSSVMNGIHSLDVGFIVSPVIAEMLRYVADSYEVEYTESLTKGVTTRQIPLHEARKIVKEVSREQEKTIALMGRNSMQAEQPQSPPSRGLMAKPSALNKMGA
jgi:Glu-tRNA(Gln) amidotransferase subunit E-like FAD-binding protein